MEHLPASPAVRSGLPCISALKGQSAARAKLSINTFRTTHSWRLALPISSSCIAGLLVYHRKARHLMGREKAMRQKLVLAARGGEAPEKVAVLLPQANLIPQLLQVRRTVSEMEVESLERRVLRSDCVDAKPIKGYLLSAVGAFHAAISRPVSSAEHVMLEVLEDPSVRFALTSVSCLAVFSDEVALAFKEDLSVLRCLKQLKYFWNLPQSHLAILFLELSRHLHGPKLAADFDHFVTELCQCCNHTKPIKALVASLSSHVRAAYLRHAEYLEVEDAQAVHPTSIYGKSTALTLAKEDASSIEVVKSKTLTTTVQIIRDSLKPSNTLLSNIYKPLGRCVAVVDSKVDALYGPDLDNYFAAHGIALFKLLNSGNEDDKDIREVERVLAAMTKINYSKQEPLLVVGGGVTADVAGFAAALYCTSVPYVMLGTSLVSGIDAGPSPLVCCNGLESKNLYGAYHPPVLTITDRGFWRSLHPGWLRHGIAEIIKIAVTQDTVLFELMEEHGPRLVETKFGTEGASVSDPAFQDACDLIVGKSMESYVRSEYGNLWETHQCRPTGYGHTWSPGYELKAGMLHGHAVSTCMGFGAYLSFRKGWLTEVDMHRILKVISDCQLCLYHPIMDDHTAIWKSQVEMIKSRGGNLCAPIPKSLGRSGYLNSLPEDLLVQSLNEYKVQCAKYARKGRGVEEHCVDVGLHNPGKNHASQTGQLTHQQTRLR